MKDKFFGVQILKDVGFAFYLKHLLTLILLIGLGYFITAISFGLLHDGDSGYFIQQLEPHYIEQAVILAIAVVVAHVLHYSMRFIHDITFYHRYDLVLIPLAVIIAYLSIVEIL